MRFIVSPSLLLLLLCVFAEIACGVHELPPSGAGIVVSVDTDLSVTKDLDALSLEVRQGASVLFEHEQLLEHGAQALPVEIEVPAAIGGAQLRVRAVGLKNGQPRVERSALVTVPTSYVGFVRLTLNYLCEGMVERCGDGRTCIQGACKSAVIAGELPNLQTSDRVSAQAACFDAAKCFSTATEVVPDSAEGCSFEAARAADINVALRLEPGSEGICTQTACWIVLDAGANGFRVGHENRVFLPDPICTRRGEGEGVRVALSSQCPAKQPGTPLCRDSVAPSRPTDATRSISVGVSTPKNAAPCMGEATRACELCGTQARTCGDGRWSEFGLCTNQGVCTPDASEPCAAGGTRTCSRDCMWGSCEDQRCDGPASRSCGSCGTQHRSCAGGAWGEWSACGDEGACTPGSEQACGSGGTQACQGDCQWSTCTMQVCDGAASDACGQCGMRTRSCDTGTAEWSDWSECRDEGECEPDSIRSCGRDGSQICGGNCRWDSACAGQACEGPASRACGFCGTQTRTCDRTSGTYSDWGACSGEGECMPDAQSPCGSGGERTCGRDCRWHSECTDQVCAGPSSERCGNCGTRARTCDTDTGEWSEWSRCGDEAECSPGETRACGADGTQSCSDECRWDDACAGQTCAGPTEQSCPNNPCVMQTRTCDERSGEWNDWEPSCPTDGCRPGDTDADGCMPHAQRTCDESSCTWDSTCRCVAPYWWCPDDTCQDLSNDPNNCGRCGRRCAEGQPCVAGGCQCVEPEANCSGRCVDTSTSREHCGGCDIACSENELCVQGSCQLDGPPQN